MKDKKITIITGIRRYMGEFTKLASSIVNKNVSASATYFPEDGRDCYDLVDWLLERLEEKETLCIVTCSPKIINRVGMYIRLKELSADNVEVLMLHNDEYGRLLYDEKGQIREWPFGFFDGDDDEYISCGAFIKHFKEHYKLN